MILLHPRQFNQTPVLSLLIKHNIHVNVQKCTSTIDMSYYPFTFSPSSPTFTLERMTNRPDDRYTREWTGRSSPSFSRGSSYLTPAIFLFPFPLVCKFRQPLILCFRFMDPTSTLCMGCTKWKPPTPSALNDLRDGLSRLPISSLSFPSRPMPRGKSRPPPASVDEIRAQNLLSFALLPSCYKPGEGGTLRSSFRAHLHA